MKKITLPNPVTLLFGSLGGFWVADIINPGFNPVGVMILILIPVFLFDLLYPKKDIIESFEEYLLAKTAEEAVSVSGEIVDEINEAEGSKET